MTALPCQKGGDDWRVQPQGHMEDFTKLVKEIMINPSTRLMRINGEDKASPVKRLCCCGV